MQRSRAVRVLAVRMAGVGAAITIAMLTVTSGQVAGAAGPAWGPAGTAPIHPGVMTFTPDNGFLTGGSSQCTANFVYVDPANPAVVYIGQAAHCSETGASTSTNGCQAASLPDGTPVAVGGDPELPTSTVLHGTMVYNSWIAMQAAGETDPNTCAYNDLALVQLPAGSAGQVNPSIPVLGGPASSTPAPGTGLGDSVYTYGNSILRAGIPVLSPKAGVSLGSPPSLGGWTQEVYTVTPGVPGDSGSAYLDGHGNPLGVLSTVEAAPCPAGNGVGSLALELAYMHSHATSLAGVGVAAGTQPFVGVAGPVPTGSSVAC